MISSSVEIPHPSLVNLYGCVIGERTFIGPFVEIQRDAVIGSNVRISSHTFICSDVTIEDNVFIGHGVMFINDKFDSPTIKDWVSKKTVVGKNVRIGSNATILPVNIGEGAIVGAGAVVTKDVEPGEIVYGNPAR